MRLTSFRLASILVEPGLASMFDAPLNIKVQQLQPNQPITITAAVQHDSGNFQSAAHYVADKDGCVDVEHHSSQGGSYLGVHPMGLFWSLRQSPGQRSGLRLLPRDVSLPVTYSLSVFDGHMHNLDSVPICDVPHRSLSRTELHRHFVHPDVSREEVAIGRVHGGLFVPRLRLGPLPAVIDLFGTAGGLVQHRAALLASHGFVVLSLAYFGYKDTPKLEELSLDYFQEAIDYLVDRPEVHAPDGVGIIGVSLGASIALLAGVYARNIKCVAWINSYNFWDAFFPIQVNGSTFPCPKQGDMQLLQRLYGDDESKVLIYKPYLETIKVDDRTELPIECAPPDRRFLLLASADDQSAHTVTSARSLLARSVAAGHTDGRVRVEEFADAGHLLEPPYIPHAAATWHKVVGRHMLWGGTSHGHAMAQIRMWKILQTFLTENLGKPASMRDASVLFGVKNKL